MNNTEATAALNTKREEIIGMENTINDAIQHLLEYEHEMGDWKASVVTAKIASIKTEATAAGVDLSTWNGSVAPSD